MNISIAKHYNQNMTHKQGSTWSICFMTYQYPIQKHYKVEIHTAFCKSRMKLNYMLHLSIKMKIISALFNNKMKTIVLLITILKQLKYRMNIHLSSSNMFTLLGFLVAASFFFCLCRSSPLCCCLLLFCLCSC